MRRLDRAADAAPEIDFPGCIDPHRVRIIRPFPAGWLLPGCAFAQSVSLVHALRLGLREPLSLGDSYAGASFPDSCCRLLEAQIPLPGSPDEVFQDRIPQGGPPGLEVRLPFGQSPSQLLMPGVRRARLRRDVVRTYGERPSAAGDQEEREKCGSFQQQAPIVGCS